MTLNIDILYTGDRTDSEVTADLLQDVMQELGVNAAVSFVEVRSDREAFKHRFIGSPSVYVNGEDLFPMPKAAAGLRLRPYFCSAGMVEHPTREMLREALADRIGKPA